MMPKILNKQTKIEVGDGGYTASVINNRVWEKYGCITVSPRSSEAKEEAHVLVVGKR